MAAPLAYFLTWTCYGQRLHGDSRGSVDREHNQPGTPFLLPDTVRERADRSRMKGEVVVLSQEMRGCARLAIQQFCDGKRWKLSACSVRPTHIHVVVTCPVKPERALTQLKTCISLALKRAGLAGRDARLWTDHGSTRWINHYNGLYGAIAYVNEWQSGPRRELLEEHKAEVRKRLESLRRWLEKQGLPGDGATVVVGESDEERAARVPQKRS